jgi:hypothetical protein
MQIKPKSMQNKMDYVKVMRDERWEILIGRMVMKASGPDIRMMSRGKAFTKRVRDKVAKRSPTQINDEKSDPNRGNQMTHIIALLGPDLNIIPNLQTL